MVRGSTDKRRADLRESLIRSAEAAIERHGLASLRARDLAQSAGCSVGAVYNAVQDLDEVALLVGQRTLGKLGADLDAANLSRKEDDADQLVAWALAYAEFARANRNRWRALFEYRTPPEKMLPGWFEAAQMGLFVRLETRLAHLAPETDTRGLGQMARTLFSAVHGIAVLGLEEKLETLSRRELDAELEAFVRTYVRGLGVAGAPRVNSMKRSTSSS